MKFKIDCPEGCGVDFCCFISFLFLRHNKAKMSSLWERSLNSFSQGELSEQRQGDPSLALAGLPRLPRRIW